MAAKPSSQPLTKRPDISPVLISAILAVLLTSFTPLLAPQFAYAQDTVLGLRQAGWKLVEKTERDQWLPGIAPYENLGRLIYIATYTFHKDGKTMTCTLARDNMRDTFEQSCTDD